MGGLFGEGGKEYVGPSKLLGAGPPPPPPAPSPYAFVTFDYVCLIKIIHFWSQPTNSDSGELFRLKLFVYVDG